MIVIAGRTNPELAKSIASSLSLPIIIANTKKFKDQELRVQIKDELYKEEIIIIQSTCNPANDNLMELLLLADTARQAGARSITALIPYFGYSRQDHSSCSHEPISASLIAKLLEAAGINQIITLDLHSKKIEDFFKINIQNLEPLIFFSKFFKGKEDNIVISPDIGGINRAQKFADILGLELVVINKNRISNGKCVMPEIIDNINGKHCIIIDDIIDTGETIHAACDLLIKSGVKSIKACITHAVLSGDSVNIIENSPLTKLYISNSIKHSNFPKKIEVIAVEDIFINTLRRHQ